MAVDVSPTSKVECLSKNIGKSSAASETEVSGDGRQGCETRSQSKTCNGEQITDKETKLSSTCGESLENSTTNVGVSTRSSTRPTKRQRSASITSGQDTAANRNGDTTCSTQDDAEQPKKKKAKKTKRQWESWGNAEKNAFFEALIEHGKDFDKIQYNIALKHKRRGDPPELVKNKDQVRHFYYRTLNKISPYLPTDKVGETNDVLKKGETNDVLKKANYELSGLICYGELWKRKISNFGKKEGQKLNELILQGTVTIRANGRNQKIKIPTCRALKKQNQLKTNETDVETEKPPPVPSKLLITLQPKDNLSWSAVQRGSKNPRLRTLISSRKTLSSLLTYLNSKWTFPATKPDQKSTLCLYPLSTITNAAKSVASKALSSGSLSSANETGSKPPLVNGKVVRTVGVITTSDLTACGNSGIRGDQCANTESSVEIVSITELQHDAKLVNGCSHSTGLKDVIDIQTTDGNDVQRDNEIVDKQTVDIVTSGDNSKDVNDKESGNTSKMWNLSNCEGITLGDLYQEFGHPEHLKLEYNWVVEEETSSPQSMEALQKLVFIASAEFLEKTEQTKKAGASSSSKSSTAKTAKLTKQAKNSPPKIYAAVAPKIVDDPVFVMPAVVSSVSALQTGHNMGLGLNQQTTNHKTFGFTPIREFIPPEPLLPKSKKSRQQRRPPRVVVQRTILPRPTVTLPGAVAVSYVAQPPGKIPIAPRRPSNVTHVHSPMATSRPGTPSPGTCRVTSPSIHIIDQQNVNVNMTNSPHQQITASTNILDLALSGVSLNNFTSDNSTFATVLASNGIHVEEMASGIAPSTPLSSNQAPQSVGIHVEEMESGIAPSTPISSSQLPLASTLTTVSPKTFSNLSQLMNGNSTIVVVGDGVDLSALGLPVSDSQGNIQLQPQALNTNSIISSSSLPVPLSSTSLMDVSHNGLNSLIMTSAQSTAGGHMSTYSTLGQSATPSLSGVSDIHLSPPASPLHIQPLGDDGNWLNGEGPDISLGSLFENLDAKTDKRNLQEPGTSDLRDDASSLDGFGSVKHLLDVESALHSMMEENSIDFVNRFQDFYTRDGLSHHHPPRTSTIASSTRRDTVASNSSNSQLSFAGLLNGQNLKSESSS